MQLTAPLLTILSLTLANTASAFRVQAYQNADCTGPSQDINVWDNTCKNKLNNIQSVTVTSYGAGRQRAAFYRSSDCNALEQWIDYYADGGSDKFLKGRCISFAFNVHAMGSRSV